MIPSKMTVVELFTQTKQYVVPLYQRPYVWARESQWEPLWEDIEPIASALAEGTPAVPHFLGAVVLAQHDVYGAELAKRDVIDGQQRLTTLQVFLAALRDHVAEHLAAATDEGAKASLQGLAESVRPLTRNGGLMGNPKVERHKVWPTNADRTVFEAVLTAESRNALDTRFPVIRRKYQRQADPGPRLVEAYRYFHDCISSFARESANGRVPPLVAMFYALQKYLQLVVIELERDDDPQAIFESLNAHGAPLRASDLIRNHVFARAQSQGEDADALYESRWRHFDEVTDLGAAGFWRQEVKQGRLRHPRFELFFQHYLAARTAREVTPIYVFQTFRSYWRDQRPEPKVSEELARIESYSKVFRWFYEPHRIEDTRPSLARFLRRLRSLDTSTVQPLLLYLLTEAADRVAPGELDAILAHIESFLVRSWICGRPSKNYNRIFTALLAALRSAPSIDGATVAGRLQGIKGDNAWPDDAAFERAWMEEPAYQNLHTGGVQMVLGAIHEQMLTSKQERVTIAGALTVEHVLPQSWHEHWPLPDDEARTPDETLELTHRRDRLLQTFGNLTLLTQPLNSSVSNGPFAQKREEYVAQALLRLNTWFYNVTTWDEDAIRARGKALFELARAIWRVPA